MSFKFESSYDGLISRADLKKLFWRSIPYEHSWNYERMGHIGFMWALMPILRKLYPQDADFKAALKRHMELYNVTPYISTLPMSIAAAMEEVNATDDSFDTSAISNVKLALMGPLSGVGDAFYWARCEFWQRVSARRWRYRALFLARFCSCSCSMSLTTSSVTC